MILKSVSSGGGPIVVIPSEYAEYWKGTNPPNGVIVPENWQWGDGSEIICDYDRACYELNDYNYEEIGMGWLKLNDQDGICLLFDLECIAFLPQETGGVFIRGFYSEEDDIQSESVQLSLDQIPIENWKIYAININLIEGRIFVFDSAYAGNKSENEITAFDGVLVANLKPGNYKIMYTRFNDVEYIKLVCYV